MVFQLADTGKVRTNADFIFFNQPTSSEGAVRLTAADQLSIDLTQVPAQVDKLAVAVSLDDSVTGSLAAIAGLGVSVTGAADRHSAPATGLTTERAAVLVESYRRSGAWKVRNVSAGWTEGLSALATAHGVPVDDEPAAPGPPSSIVAPPAATPPPPVQPAPTPVPSAAATPAPTDPASTDPVPVRSVPGEATLSLVKRQKLDLRKREVGKVLLTKGAQHERAHRPGAGQDRVDGRRVRRRHRAPRRRTDGSGGHPAGRRRVAGVLPLRGDLREAARYPHRVPGPVDGRLPPHVGHAPGHRLPADRRLQRRDPDHDRDPRHPARPDRPDAGAVLHRRRVRQEEGDHQADLQGIETGRRSGNSSASATTTSGC